LIAGSISPELKDTFENYIKEDPRIIFLGWLNSSELKKWISASDLYLQPGGQSVSMQLSLCCGTPVAVKSFPSHQYLFDNQMPFIDDIGDLKFLFNQVNKEYLTKLSFIAFDIASKKLNYEILSNQYIPTL
jgi:glycosyltransferase involved in cell wall biosynthesis